MRFTPAAVAATQMIQCRAIDWPDAHQESRTRDKGVSEALARSIEAEGQHHAITVVPSPDRSGRYLGVIGWHRWYAMSKILKRKTIEANVRSGWTSDDIAMAQRSENLYRNPLSKAQHAKALSEWCDLYDKRRKAYEDACTAIQEPASDPEHSVSSEMVHSGPSGRTGKPEPPPLPAAPPKNFVKMASEVTGQSRTSVKRSLAIGRAFDSEQINILDQMGVDNLIMEKIAKLPSGEDRNQIVNLVATGMPPAEAIAAVTGAETIKLCNGREVAAKARSEESLDDREWLDTYCSDVLKLLKHKEAYEADALLYRHTRDARLAFSTKIRKPLGTTLAGASKGSYFWLFHRFVNISHPKHWLMCPDCSGSGAVAGRVCAKCSGQCFATKKEV